MTLIAASFRIVLLALAALLPIINPPGSAPIFLSMTPGAGDPERSVLARRIAVSSAFLLIGAMVVGSYMLIFFGLSLAVVKIAGGLLVISTGWHLLGAGQSRDHALVEPTPVWGAEEIESISFYPLTFPLTIGPGAVSVAMTLGAGAREHGVSRLIATLDIAFGAVLIALIVYLCYRFASRLQRWLGKSGTVVLLRLSAFILLAVGVQILCDGLADRFAIFKSPAL